MVQCGSVRFTKNRFEPIGSFYDFFVRMGYVESFQENINHDKRGECFRELRPRRKFLAGTRNALLRMPAENHALFQETTVSDKNCGNCVLTRLNRSEIIVVARRHRPPLFVPFANARRPADHGGCVDELIRSRGCFGRRAHR